MYGYHDQEKYLSFEDAPTLDDEVRDQVQEVFHFRNVEHLPIERSYE